MKGRSQLTRDEKTTYPFPWTVKTTHVRDCFMMRLIILFTLLVARRVRFYVGCLFLNYTVPKSFYESMDFKGKLPTILEVSNESIFVLFKPENKSHKVQRTITNVNLQ